MEAKELIAYIDLTSLNDDDTPEDIAALCQRAITPLGSVAAVCVYPKFVSQAVAELKGTGIQIATVANFPTGDDRLHYCIQQIQQAIEDGANEIDVVMPYGQFLSGDSETVSQYLRSCHSICHNKATLKVILETGELIAAEVILAAAELAIASGADFIKTSTGKVSVGATHAAAEAMLTAIKQHPEKNVGLKLSGGVRTVKQVMEYISLIDAEMGKQWITPATFRIGASKLLDDIL